MASDLARDGYMVLPRFLDRAGTEGLRDVCADIKARWLRCDPLTGLPSVNPGVETCLRHVTHPAYFAGSPVPLRQLLQICADGRVLALLERCWRDEPIFRSTSLFFNPSEVSEEGCWHRDSQFSTGGVADDDALGAGAGAGREGMQVQIPLMDDDALEYVPGSHRRPDTDAERRTRFGDGGTHAREPLESAVRISASAGDAVFFDPNGLHRGRSASHQPRLTLMVTYTRASAAPTIDRLSYQPWLLEPGYLDDVPPAVRRTYVRFLEHYSTVWPADKECVRPYHSGRGS